MPQTITRDPNMAISLPAAIAGGIILIAYFLILSMLGLETVTELRFINFILLIPIVIYSLRTYVNTAHGKSYLEAFRVSILSFFGSYLILAVFMLFYLLVIDKVFMAYLQEYVIPGVKLNAFGAMALIIGEGAIGSVILSFVILQFYKSRIKRMA